MANRKSTEWVRRWGGALRVVTIIKTTEQDRDGLEVAVTLEMKSKFGFGNVRGGLDNNPGDNSRAIPRYWQVPPDGLTPRTRSNQIELIVPDEINEAANRGPPFEET